MITQEQNTVPKPTTTMPTMAVAPRNRRRPLRAVMKLLARAVGYPLAFSADLAMFPLRFLRAQGEALIYGPLMFRRPDRIKHRRSFVGRYHASFGPPPKQRSSPQRPADSQQDRMNETEWTYRS
jgi:hypothetical protein